MSEDYDPTFYGFYTAGICFSNSAKENGGLLCILSYRYGSSRYLFLEEPGCMFGARSVIRYQFDSISISASIRLLCMAIRYGFVFAAKFVSPNHRAFGNLLFCWFVNFFVLSGSRSFIGKISHDPLQGAGS
jgi:hypothetical protein